MSRKKPALGLDPRVGTGFAKKDMLKQSDSGMTIRRKLILLSSVNQETGPCSRNDVKSDPGMRSPVRAGDVIWSNTMPRFEDLDPDSQKVLGNFPCRDDGPSPWTPLQKPLSACTLAIVTSSGLIRRSDKPFDLGRAEGDPSFRTIPTDANPAELTFSHVSTNWDRTGFAMDINVVFPIDRLRELAREGEIEAVADEHYSFMGAIFNSDPLVADTAPEVGRRLQAAGVDIVLLVPT